MTDTIQQNQRAMGYDGTAAVYFIDDGEQHHYVARSAWEALRSHIVEHGCESLDWPREGLSIVLCAPDSDLGIGQENDPPRAEDMPAVCVVEQLDWRTAGWCTRVTAKCAEWAHHYASRGTVQICTTVH